MGAGCLFQFTYYGFKLATSMTVDKRSIHYAMNSPCDWFVHITFNSGVIKCMYYSKKSGFKKLCYW